MAMLDLRRRDQRSNIRENPFWITSAEINNECDDAEAGLFSFPATLGNYFLHEFVVEILTEFAGGTITLDIGSGTLATDIVTTGGTLTVVDADLYMINTEITHGTLGLYPGGLVTHTFTIAGTTLVLTGTPWAMAKVLAAGDGGSGTGSGDVQNLLIKGAAATVPIIYATLVSDAAITAGSARLHVLVSKLP